MTNELENKADVANSSTEITPEAEGAAKKKPSLGRVCWKWSARGIGFLLFLVGLATTLAVGRLVYLVCVAKPLDAAYETIDDNDRDYAFIEGETSHWKELSNRKAIVFQRAFVTDADLKSLVNREDVAAVYLVQCQNITDAGVELLASLPNLRRLVLDGCPRLENPDFSKFSRLDLKRLSVRNCPKLTDKSARKIAKIRSLKILQMTGCDQLTEKGVLPLASLPLMEFAPPECLLKDETISGITRFERLRDLVIAGKRGEKLPLTDSGIAALGSMRKLRGVRVENCPNVSETALKELCAAANAKRSSIYDWELEYELVATEPTIRNPRSGRIGTYDRRADLSALPPRRPNLPSEIDVNEVKIIDLR
ncbi:MAG: hypothetical protein IJM30_12815 [Thermoguttaceae bacterium]|nr:hypothetical protein [Thermoguttaceae bacterium]